MITDEQVEAALKAEEKYYKTADGNLFSYIRARRLLPSTTIHEAMRKALEAAEQVAWQPIETAPRDGTVIDLWCEEGRITDCSWVNKLNSFGTPCYDVNIGWDDEPVENATHWRPLPEPPKPIKPPIKL